MSAHESFEQLCALAVTGDLEPEEFRRLGEHLYECASCRAAYRDFHAIVERGLPAIEATRPTRWSFPRWGMKKRFAQRAAREGIAFQSSRKWTRAWHVLAPATAALLVIGLLGYASYVYRSIQDRQRAADSRIAVLSNTVTELERRLSERQAPAPSPAIAPSQPLSSDREQELQRQLSLLRDDYDAAVAGRSEFENRIAALSAELEGIREDSRTARSEVERLQRNLNNAETTLARTNREVESLRTGRSADAVVIAQQRSRLSELTAMSREQAETIERERSLLAVGKDIRDLMGARNLRIVDVQDDGTGKVRSLAGRIFYTQGKSLIFYAYDLQNRGNVSRVDFQVWGKKEGRSQAPRSLGILYIDEPVQNRWMLKFENPDVLAQIDQVFVTVEPHGGSTQPTGKQLLTAAFLNESPNHP
jgi:archaellum component FlaC